MSRISEHKSKQLLQKYKKDMRIYDPSGLDKIESDYIPESSLELIK